VSPILKATRGSRWREDVEATWNYLKIHYHITTNDECSTHIHISLDPCYSGDEIKRIAQAIIHFEPALEALVPPTRRGNVYTKSNWLDSPTLQRANKSRSQLIDDIKRANYASTAVRLMQNTDDRDYSWNFWSIYSKETIEFRKPPASTTAEEALAWAEFAISFIQASIMYEDTTLLQKIPPTIGGLRWFLSRFPIPGVSEPKRMQRLWKGKDPTAMLEPVPNTSIFFPWEQKLKEGRVARLKEMAEYERQRNQQLAREAKEPYW
jgi:Putative amidoligase enzyme